MPDAREYSETYQTTCKHIWYSHGRCSEPRLLELVPIDEFGRKPSIDTIGKWRVEQLWGIWADTLDEKALAKAENNLIKQKADMLRRHADLAQNLITKATDYLNEEGFDTSASAVAAIIKGATLERESRGLGEMMVRISQMSDDDMKKEIAKLANRAGENGQFIDGEEIAKDIDTEST
jgi:hypothetical protein